MSARNSMTGLLVDPPGLVHRTSLVDRLLAEQRELSTAVLQFSRWHERAHGLEDAGYRTLVPLSRPKAGEQYAFEVDLDRCTACKACVVACHSLNGLDGAESWRDVGAIHAPRENGGTTHTVTTACHHCEDPACAHGCPVLAYEKDEETGIVRHLDDQCIGCSYCILKCPYEVPKFNERLGIVRKCDMCQGRLAAGEAPACVQSCPNEAIRITVVQRETSHLPARAPMVPGAFPSGYTRPTTRYVSSRALPPAARPADAAALRVEEAHTPLAVMLVLTQCACGVLWLADGSFPMLLAGWLLAHAGLAASLAHLGQPLKAWRAFLGWRRSWLSREIIAFGLFGAMATASLFGVVPAAAAAAAGFLGLAASVMVYADTRREFWQWPLTGARFAGTAVVGGLAVAGIWHSQWIAPAVVAAMLKLLAELAWLAVRRHTLAARLHSGPLRAWTAGRFLAGFAGAALFPAAPAAGAVFLVAGELIERSLFFRACPANRMPGVG